MKFLQVAVVVMAWAGFAAAFAQLIWSGVKNWSKGRVIPITGWLILSFVVGLAGLALHLILNGA